MNIKKCVSSLIILLVLLPITSCSSNVGPESDLWGTWNIADNQNDNSDYDYNIQFSEDRAFILGNNREQAGEYVVIAPGRIKISMGDNTEVLDYELDGNSLKIYFNEGYNLYTRSDAVNDNSSNFIPTPKDNVEEKVESVIKGREVITPENSASLVELKRSGKLTWPIADIDWLQNGVLAVGTSIGFYLYDDQSLEEITFIEAKENIISIAFSPERQTFASGGGNGVISLWDVNSGKLVNTLEEHTNGVFSIAFSLDGRILASGSADGTIHLWDLDSATIIDTHKDHTSYIFSLAFSPDGRTLASGSIDSTIRLWDVDSGAMLDTLKVNPEGILSVTFSPDGQTLASAGYEGTIRLWDVNSGRLLDVLKADTNLVNCVAFSPDGQILTSGGGGTIRLWNVENGVLLETMEGLPGSVYSVDFSPNGQILASGSSDGTIRLWGIP
jgi:WD40 repeat protein